MGCHSNMKTLRFFILSNSYLLLTFIQFLKSCFKTGRKKIVWFLTGQPLLKQDLGLLVGSI